MKLTCNIGSHSEGNRRRAAVLVHRDRLGCRGDSNTADWEIAA